ncbi:MAG: primase C-terminal domain-containing protein [Acidaminococcaceae bacterium]|nr:primase C-terminal domain-containing protein [Acidaminococcaceae bacterium]
MKLTIFSADCTGNEKNCVYQHKQVVTNEEEFRQALRHDHVCAEFKGNRRSIDNFIKADCLVMDCDNDHTDEPGEWVTPAKVQQAFQDVQMAFFFSRNHGKEKDGKSARPRFHVYFPIAECTDPEVYVKLKQEILFMYPFFDSNAMDAARFIYGSGHTEVVWVEGTKTVDKTVVQVETEIPEGRRNATMSHFAGRIIKKLGDTPEAYEAFLEQAEKCNPPLSDEELNNIWKSAVKFGKKVSSQPGYIPPELFNAEFSLKPEDYSDVGQARVLVREYGEELRYSPATGYIRYNGKNWDESKERALAACQELTDRQMQEAEDMMAKAWKSIADQGAATILLTNSKLKAVQQMNDSQRKAYDAFKAAGEYHQFVITRRDTKYLKSCLVAATPMLSISERELDQDGFLLNTPDGTFYLPDGLDGIREHQAGDYITKITNVSPGYDGMDIWLEALAIFFCNDQELIDYVQRIVGLAAIGKVYVEAFIIAYGDGRNGKSTFWNAIAYVLGTYAGKMSADTLTVGCKRNVKPELAEAKGKRLLIAAELEEGQRLNTSNIKQLCSTDDIYAEKKYKDPFYFTPTHTLVLYSNYLPRVGANDPGTWRRLIVIPFLAKIEGRDDIKNYGDYLIENAGPAILTWIIEGAQAIIKDRFHIVRPQVVEDAIHDYKDSNNWLGHFIEDCCEVDKRYQERSGNLYTQYRNYCMGIGEYIRSTSDFYAALQNAGFEKYRNTKGRFIRGLRIRVDDFLE